MSAPVTTRERRFAVAESAGEVGARIVAPADAWAWYVLAHGAGAGMRHAFLEACAARFAAAGIATFRFQFPYTEAGGRRPDPPALLEGTVRAAVREAAVEAAGLPLFAGGKSMGGRMTSQAQSKDPLPGVRGLVFLGFPLHAPRRPAASRAAHLAAVGVPMLFVQGTRDDLADLALMRGVAGELGGRATLHVVEGGDHSFRVLKRSGRGEEAVMDEVCGAVAFFMRAVIAAQ